MKKLVVSVLLMLSLLLSFASCDWISVTEVQDESGTEGLEYYPLPDGTYGVMAGKTQYLTEIKIASTYNGKPVTQILPEAFKNATNLTSLTIPDSVTSIGKDAFDGCSKLSSVVIGNGITIIDKDMFKGCTALTSVKIGNGVTSIGYAAFYNCDTLTDVYYTGSEEEWQEIKIGSDNDYLTDATIHYNYVP